MKRLLIMLLLLLQLSVPGINAQTISFSLPDSLAGKNWVRNLIQEEFKKVGTKPVDPVVPVPGKKDCPAGPILTKVISATYNSLKFQFHGDGVIELEYWIKSPQDKEASHGLVQPTGNIIEVSFTNAGIGTYQILLKGSSCNSVLSVGEFYVSATGAVDPIVPAGEYQTITRGLPEHADFRWTYKDGRHFVTDHAPVNIGSDYEYRYLVGSTVVVTGKKPLENYEVSGFAGRIVKYKIKPQYATLNHWTDKASDEGSYYSLTAAEGFPFNGSVAFHTFALPGTKGSFVNPFPADYDPSTQQVQWADRGWKIKLPKGHVYIENPRPWGIPRAFELGVTHISNYALPWDEGAPFSEVIRLRDEGLSYVDVPRIETVLGITKSGNSGETWKGGVSKDWWPNWGDYGINQSPGYKEGYEMGLRADISHAIFIGEFSENVSWLPADAEVFRGFYDAYMPRMEERFGKRGIPYLVCHDYLLLGGETLSNGRAQAKKILSLSKEQMPVSNFSPGRSLAKTNLIVETVYLAAPDNVTAQPYELIFRLEWFKQMGYEAGVFLAGIHEWRPNNRYEIVYKDGKAYFQNKMPLDPNQHIANGFLAQVFGKFFIEWGGNTKTSDGSKDLAYDWEGSDPMWFPTGATQAQPGFPYISKPGREKYFGYSGSTDLSFLSQKLFSDTYAHVEGGKDKYLRFRIDGGSWIDPTDKDYIDAYYDKRGFVHSRTIGGKTAFFYLSSYQRDNKSHTIEVELPNGQLWSGTVAGNAVHAQLI